MMVEEKEEEEEERLQLCSTDKLSWLQGSPDTPIKGQTKKISYYLVQDSLIIS